MKRTRARGRAGLSSAREGGSRPSQLTLHGFVQARQLRWIDKAYAYGVNHSIGGSKRQEKRLRRLSSGQGVREGEGASACGEMSTAEACQEGAHATATPAAGTALRRRPSRGWDSETADEETTMDTAEKLRWSQLSWLEGEETDSDEDERAV